MQIEITITKWNIGVVGGWVGSPLRTVTNKTVDLIPVERNEK